MPKERVLKVKFFLGSTTEELEKQMLQFLGDKTCPGNYINFQLYKLGNVYQGILFYAKLT